MGGGEVGGSQAGEGSGVAGKPAGAVAAAVAGAAGAAAVHRDAGGDVPGLTRRPLPTLRELRLGLADAEVDSLAAAIRAVFQSDCTPPTEWERQAARAALRWMRDREAGL